MVASTTSNSSLDGFLAPLPPTAINSLNPRLRSVAPKAHYRPISTIISPPSDSEATGSDLFPSKSRLSNTRNRPLSTAFHTMGFLKPTKSKGKEKEERPITPQRDGFFNRTLKPKKSLNSLMVLREESPSLSSTPPALYTPSLSSTFAESSTAGYSNASTPTAGSASGSSSSTFTPVIGSPEISSGNLDDYEYTHGDRYEAKENWITRKHRLKLHPYGAEAPYMQSYDSVSLSVDRFTHQLLRRLNSNGTPSFYNYVKNKKPIPSSILDLGCGEGHWIIDAHASWPEAHIVGFDLVDVILPEIRQNERLNFVRGNFIRYALPFPHSSFDLVRVSNLSLAIPTERWNFVLSEIHRVLQVGGRLELIDDAVCFPYGQETFAPSPRRQTFATAPNRRRHSFDDQESSAFDLSNSDDDDAEETDNDHHFGNQAKDGDGQTIPQTIPRDDAGEVKDQETDPEKFNRSVEELTPSVDDDGSSECPSSPETNGDGLFLDVEDSQSSASSLQDLDQEDYKLSSLRPLSLPTSRRSIRPLPPPRRPLPPIPPSPSPMNTIFPSTVKPCDDEDDLVTPTKLDITLPTPALVLNTAELSSSSQDSAKDESNTVSSPELTPEVPVPSPLNEDTSDWANSAKDGKALETVFFNMLETKYGIHTRTPKGITSYLKDTFGADNVRKLRTMHLKLAPSELEELIPQTKRPKFRVRSLSKGTELDTHPKGKEEFGVAKKQPKNGDTDAKKEKKSKKEKEHGVPFPTLKDSTTRSRANTFESNVVRSSSESSAIPSTLSAKAAGRLGITYSALAAATNSAQTDTSSSVASVYSNRSSSSIASMSRVSDEFPRNSSDTQPSVNFPQLSIPVQQSPGLLLLPSTFIPLPPVELEMHACKHMHALLSCKRAISDWLLYNDDGSDNDCISEDSLRDVFFEYDFFRRRRLNWPSQAPEIDINDHDYKKNIEIPFEGPKSTGSRSSTFSIDSRLSSTSEASIGPYNRHELTHVRTFRVYFAVKTRRLSYSAST
ncbi:hypothetical protein DFJ43DRAFT_1076306 [Lentinula guzmanii]|uniref:Methyltransferase domain-containing protein n=1 Tax=Lentinula guzmanii TaxID=2804957 RepID=A0AA38JJY4_9AGAR|nr:hypothetical protein DFJ43DRAFT_1076306 [Lentinula guzmanii]